MEVSLILKRLLALTLAFTSVASTAFAAAGAAAKPAGYATAQLHTSLALPTIGIFLLVLVLAAAVGPAVARKAPPHPKELDQH